MSEENNNPLEWTTKQVLDWARLEKLSESVLDCIENEAIDGKCILTFTEQDIRELRDKYNYNLRIRDIKKLWISTRHLQHDNHENLSFHGLLTTDNNLINLSTSQQRNQSISSLPIPHLNSSSASQIGCSTNDYLYHNQHQQHQQHLHHHHHHHQHANHNNHDMERISPPLSVDGRATSIQPEFFKTMISLGYAFLVTWITAFVMVVVHERVPDMKRYPPLPDIFLDNVPHIPWAFHMCEITGTLLFSLWAGVLLVHKHRMVLLRRFFALSGTVFLLRCVTMIITSLSVPGTHLQCNPKDYEFEDTNLGFVDSIILRISRAYTIWSGLGMSIQGVRTCGDYMFSGHTVALTILNFFITEYTPRHLYFLHTIAWLLNMFGIFFILAAHEHYSIDVFIAFYITSRLFLYYHTLANNQALMSHDSNRTRIWFPMFSYFESSVDGIIPNEYDTIQVICSNIFSWIIAVKDCCMLTARRYQNNLISIDYTKLTRTAAASLSKTQQHNLHNDNLLNKTLNNIQDIRNLYNRKNNNLLNNTNNLLTKTTDLTTTIEDNNDIINEQYIKNINNDDNYKKHLKKDK